MKPCGNLETVGHSTNGKAALFALVIAGFLPWTAPALSQPAANAAEPSAEPASATAAQPAPTSTTSPQPAKGQAREPVASKVSPSAKTPSTGGPAAATATPNPENDTSEVTAEDEAEAPETLAARLEALAEQETATKELKARIQAAPSDERELLQEQLKDADERYWSTLWELSEIVAQEPAPDVDPQQFAQARRDVTRHLAQEERKIIQHFDANRREMRALGVEIDKADAEAKAELAMRRIEKTERVPELLDALSRTIDARAALKQPTKPSIAQLSKRLSESAHLAGAALHRISDDLEHIKASADGSLTPEQSDQKAELLERQGRFSEIQKKLLALMDQRGMDTAQHRQDLIRYTGEVSEDILNAEVAKGLIGTLKQDALDWISEHAMSIAFKVVSFFLILILFAAISRVARWLARRAVNRAKGMSNLAADFFVKSVGRVVVLVGWIVAAAQVGIEVGPLLAGLGIAGFVLGFALQSTLSNFASGMMILVYRPFDVGDAVEAGGVLGKVHAMNLVSTSIVTFDNQMLIIPNTKVWGDVIRNITHQQTRRVDLMFGISYSDDLDHAQKILEDVLAKNERVLEEPEPVVRLHELGDSSVNFVVRPWVKTAEYWDAYWEITREVKRRFDAEGVTIPFPQRDLHVHGLRAIEGGSRQVSESQVAPAQAEGAE